MRKNFIILLTLLLYYSSVLATEWHFTSIGTNSGRNVILLCPDDRLIITRGDLSANFIDLSNFACVYVGVNLSFRRMSQKISSDGLYYLDVGASNMSIIIDAINLKLKKKLGRKEFPLKNSQFASISDNMKYVIGVDNKNLIYVYDYASGKLLHHFDSLQSLRAYSLDISEDGELLAGVYSNSIFVINLKTGEMLREYDISGGNNLMIVKLSPNKKNLLIYSNKSNYIFCFKLDLPYQWNMANCNLMPYSVSFRVNSEQFFVTSSDGIKEYDFETGEFEHKINIPGVAACDAAMIDSYGLALTLSDSVIVWDYEKAERIDVYPAYLGVGGLEYNYDDRFLYFRLTKPGWGGTQKYRADIRTGELMQTYDSWIGELMKHKNWFWNFKDSSQIIFQDVFSLDTVMIKTLPFKLRRIHFSDNLKYYQVSNSFSGTNYIFDWETDFEVYRNDSAWGYGFSPQANYIHSWEGTLDSNEKYLLRSFPAAELILDLTESAAQTHFPYITEDEKYLYIIRDSFLLKYELPSGIILNTLKMYPGSSGKYLVSQNNRYLLESLRNGDIMIRDMISDVVIDSIPGINSGISQMGLSSDEKYFFVNYSAGFLRVIKAPDYIVSVSEAKGETKKYVEILPNPASSKIRILIDENISPFTVTLNSVLGKIYNISSYDRVGGELILDVSNLAMGLYFVCIKYSEGSSVYGKFIKL